MSDHSCAELSSPDGSLANATCVLDTCLCKANPTSGYSEESLSKKDTCNFLLNLAFTLQSSSAFLFLAWINDTISSTLSMRSMKDAKVMGKLEYQVRWCHTNMFRIHAVTTLWCFALVVSFVATSYAQHTVPSPCFSIPSLVSFWARTCRERTSMR